jgi:hypothetical protein
MKLSDWLHDLRKLPVPETERGAKSAAISTQFAACFRKTI